METDPESVEEGPVDPAVDDEPQEGDPSTSADPVPPDPEED